MQVPSACPAEETLRRIGDASIDDATYAVLEEHVESCPACQEIVERLARRIQDVGPLLPEPERYPDIQGFAIQRELGRSRLAVVYLALRTNGLERPVALKVLPSNVAADEFPGARRRWLREARAVASIRHPNVVTIYDHGEDNGWFYLVLEYVEGGTLKERLGEPLPPHEAARILEKIARAAEFLHEQRLHHLDLKPSNILLDGAKDSPVGEVAPKLSDFGLALSDNPDAPGLSETTTLIGVRGTPAYMAPEQTGMTSERPGPWTDIHALGAILYEMLTGRSPYLGTSMLETLDQVRHKEPVPPRMLVSRLPRDLETIVLKCLEKPPIRRYNSAGSLADDLRRWLDGKPILARPVSPVEHLWRWFRRQPVVGALAATLLLSLSLGFITAVVLWRHAEWERVHAEAGTTLVRRTVYNLLLMRSRGMQKQIPPDGGIEDLQHARSGLLALANSRSSDPIFGDWPILGLTDVHLGRALESQSRAGEARRVYEEGLLDWDRFLRRHPLDASAVHHRMEIAVNLARIVDKQGELHERIKHWEKVIALSHASIPVLDDRDRGTLTEGHIALASLVERLGDYARARALLEANLRILNRVPASGITIPIKDLRLRTRSELAQLIGRSPLRESDGLTAEEWAQRVAALLCTEPGSDTGDPLRECGIVDMLVRMLHARGSELRQARKLDEARAIFDRSHSLILRLVSRFPDQPAAHRTLVMFPKN